jgi:hypothetical protein
MTGRDRARSALETRYRADGTVCETVTGTAAMPAVVLLPPERKVF